MTTTITITKIIGGWRVTRFKDAGIDKGEAVLATVCGGNLGKIIAAQTARTVAEMDMVDEIVIDMGEAPVTESAPFVNLYRTLTAGEA